jgi:hypothetical protein
LGPNSTFWAKTLFAACYQALFGKVGDIGGKYWEYLSNETVGTNDINPFFPSIYNRPQQQAHTVMKELIAL